MIPLIHTSRSSRGGLREGPRLERRQTRSDSLGERRGSWRFVEAGKTDKACVVTQGE